MSGGKAWASHSLYVAYDETGTVLYVGCTGNPDRRLKAHRSESHWWKHHTCVEFSAPMPYREALKAEQELIWTLGPIFNRLGVGDRIDFGLEEAVAPATPALLDSAPNESPAERRAS